MLIRIKEILLKKIASLRRYDQLYIIPTLDGIKLVILNFILLVIGLIYANNYVLLFNFILFCLFLGSMYYTHFNLQGLKLVSAKLAPFHVGETGILQLNFKSSSGLGHHFLNLFLKNETSLKFVGEKHSFSILDFSQENNISIKIPIQAIKRGQFKLTTIYLETLFPFHLFRTFTYLNPKIDVVIYPEKKSSYLHTIKKINVDLKNDGDDFSIKEFQTGDSLKRVHWKKLAQTNRWYSKNVISETALPVILSFSDIKISKKQKEAELSSMAHNLYDLHFQNFKYGVALTEKIYIAPGNSINHLNKCLSLLAIYEI